VTPDFIPEINHRQCGNLSHFGKTENCKLLNKQGFAEE